MIGFGRTGSRLNETRKESETLIDVYHIDIACISVSTYWPDTYMVQIFI